MRNGSIGVLLFLIACGQPVGLLAQEEQQLVDGKVAQAIQENVLGIHKSLGFSGAVLAAKDGKIILATAYGPANVDEKPLEPNALFEIASCTKLFTAVAVMQLAESGKLDLDDPISRHVPGVPDNCSKITIRHLVAHTSGIPGSNTAGSATDAEAAFKSFLRGGPRHTPGTHYEYWNQGYSILSEIIARASGMSYTEYVKKKIFDPAGMTVSCFTGDARPDDVFVAVGRSKQGNRSAVEHPYGSYGFQYRGMGGMVTNVFDLWKCDRALADNRLLNKASFAEMLQVGVGQHRLGWQVRPSPDGKSCHGHTGGVRGFRAQMWRYPSIDGALFVLCNDDASSTFWLVQSVAEKMLFGNEVDVAIPNRPDDGLLAKAAGTYFDARKRRLVIANRRDRLPTLKIYWGGPVTHGFLALTPAGKHALYMMSPSSDGGMFKVDSELEFAMKDDDVQSVSLLGLNPKLTFKKEDH